jgi:hyperosmotically inducible protein
MMEGKIGIAAEAGEEVMQNKMQVGLFALVGIAVLLITGCTANRYGSGIVKEGDIEQRSRATAHSQNATERLADATISSAIRAKFSQDEMVSHSDINVDTLDGHVTLSGAVAGQVEADRAVRLGRSVDGVKSVHWSVVARTESK